MTHYDWIRANKLIFRYDRLNNYICDNVSDVEGLELWVCDFRVNSSGMSRKSVRNLKPTLARVIDTHKLGYVASMDLKPIHFKEVKNGSIIKENN